MARCFCRRLRCGSRRSREYRKRVDWIQTYIFPGSELASVVGDWAIAGAQRAIDAEGHGKHQRALCEDACALA